MSDTPLTIYLHDLPSHLWHAAKNLLETAIAPLLLFYVLFQFAGINGGIMAALGWAVAALAWRLVRRARIPGVLMLTTALLVVRAVIGFTTGSWFLFFLQPSVQNFLIALVLLLSLPFERAFIAKLADDFCALPPTLTSNARVQRFFRRVSVLWALVFVINGAGTLWALAVATLGDFLMVATLGSYTLVGAGIVVSLLWFRRELRGEGIQLRFAARTAATAR